MAQMYDREKEIEKLARSVRMPKLNIESSLPQELPLTIHESGDVEARLILEDIYDDAVIEALNYCNRDTVLIGMTVSIRDLAKIRYNQQGAEGESSRGEGGVSQSFEEGIPRKIRTALNNYRLAKVRRF